MAISMAQAAQFVELSIVGTQNDYEAMDTLLAEMALDADELFVLSQAYQRAADKIQSQSDAQRQTDWAAVRTVLKTDLVPE